MEKRIVEESELSSVIQYITNRVSADNFDCLEDLQEWFANLTLSNWEDVIVFKEETYNRIPLCSGELFDLLLICWKPNQGSPYHPHPKYGCLVKVLRGTLTEEFKDESGDIRINNYNVGDSVYICNDMGVHRVSNTNDSPVVSLHLYAPGDYTP